MEDVKKDLFSPCKQVCSIEPSSGYCLGCGRSRSEIKAWRSSEQEWRSAVLSELPDRMTILTEMRKKKRALNRANRRARLKFVKAQKSD